MTLSAALSLAAEGFAVFPVVGKRPITPRGVYSASKDPRVFCSFDWGRGVDCAVATGAVSGVDVLDVDVRKAQTREEQGSSSSPIHDPDDVDGFDTLAQFDPLPVTRCATTPNGGAHYWFAHIEGSRSRRLGPGLEWFSDKKLVVVPPAQGREWLRQWPIGEVPEWLRAMVLAEGDAGMDGGGILPALHVTAPNTNQPAIDAKVPKQIYSLILRLMPKATPREQRWARALFNVVAQKRQGRNAALYYAAKRFCDVPIPRAGAAQLLILACKANGYLAKDGEEACRMTIMSGLGLKEWAHD